MIFIHYLKVKKDNDASQIKKPSTQNLTQMDGIQHCWFSVVPEILKLSLGLFVLVPEHLHFLSNTLKLKD
jgi:hypothetical protein